MSSWMWIRTHLSCPLRVRRRDASRETWEVARERDATTRGRNILRRI